MDIGDRVRKGQLLAELWVPELVEDFHQKEATVIHDEALIVQAREMLRAAEANYNWAGARLRLAEASKLKAEADVIRWKAQYHRDGKLAKKEYVSREGLEITTDQFQSAEAAKAEAVAAVEAAQAAQAESNAQRAKAVADLRVAEARLRVAHADRDHAAAILSYSRIEAPYEGVISRRGTDTGTYVQPPASSRTSASSPSPLFEVVRTDLVRIFVDVPESDAPFVRDGGTAQVRVQALWDREFSGCVVRSSWLLDNQTRTLRTEIDLSNSEGHLRPGMYATARLIVEHPRALTVPSSAVFHQDDQDWVIQVVRGNAVRTPVKLGLRGGQLSKSCASRCFPFPWASRRPGRTLPAGS